MYATKTMGMMPERRTSINQQLFVWDDHVTYVTKGRNGEHTSNGDQWWLCLSIEVGWGYDESEE
jgi:hypothetical protein